MTKSRSAGHLFAVFIALSPAVFAQLPEPPQQHEPWSPPAARDLPDFISKTVPLIFNSGLADPRGGSYRQVEIDVWRAAKPIETHCWVFNDSYAVCWDGLVYKIRSAGAAANLDDDVRALASADPWRGSRPIIGTPPPATFWSPLRGLDKVAPVAILLLLRLNRPDLAALLWQAPESSNINLPLAINFPQLHAQSLPQFLDAAFRTWLGKAFGVLVSARENGDNRGAMDLARSLLDWRPRATAEEASALGSSRNLSFLDPVPELLADSQRRLLEPARAPLNLDALDKEDLHDPTVAAFLAKPQAARIADLIDRLEDAKGSKLMWPGPMIFSFDPTYHRLLKEGLPAVAPLIDAWEHDTRLAFTLDYSRPWIVDREMVPVSDVAKAVVSDILSLPDLVAHSTPAELRVWWSQHKGQTQLDLKFELLKTDTATPEEWEQSARAITLRSDINLVGGSIPVGGCKPGAPAPPLHGEALRSRQNPSVQDLLIKRTQQLAAKSSAASCRVAFASFLWDRSTSLPALQAAAGLEACRLDSQMTAARIAVGDPAAAAQWVAAIRSDVAKPSFFTHEFAPLWLSPANPVLSAAAQELFANPQAPRSPHRDFSDIHSPLLALPVYRAAVLDALNDASAYGSATRSADGYLNIRANNTGWGGATPDVSDPRNVPRGRERTVRVKDMIAWQLSTLDGAPRFQPDWPASDKDPLIAQIADFLKARGDSLRAFPGKLEDTACFPDSVYFSK